MWKLEYLLSFHSTVFPFGMKVVILNDSVSYYTFLETGHFDVSLIVKSDKYCTDTIKKSILINESPKVNFYTQQYCFGDFTWFHDVTEISNDNLIEWEWNFGDGFSRFVNRNGLVIGALALVAAFACISWFVLLLCAYLPPN